MYFKDKWWGTAGKDPLFGYVHVFRIDPNLEIGSISRSYFIGRGVVELSAQKAASTGLTLNAYWTGAHGNTRLEVATSAQEILTATANAPEIRTKKMGYRVNLCTLIP